MFWESTKYRSFDAFVSKTSRLKLYYAPDISMVCCYRRCYEWLVSLQIQQHHFANMIPQQQILSSSLSLFISRGIFTVLRFEMQYLVCLPCRNAWSSLACCWSTGYVIRGVRHTYLYVWLATYNLFGHVWFLPWQRQSWFSSLQLQLHSSGQFTPLQSIRMSSKLVHIFGGRTPLSLLCCNSIELRETSDNNSLGMGPESMFALSSRRFMDRSMPSSDGTGPEISSVVAQGMVSGMQDSMILRDKIGTILVLTIVINYQNLQLRQQANLCRNRASDIIVVNYCLLQLGQQTNLCWNRARDLIARHIELSQWGHKKKLRRDGARKPRMPHIDVPHVGQKTKFRWNLACKIVLIKV